MRYWGETEERAGCLKFLRFNLVRKKYQEESTENVKLHTSRLSYQQKELNEDIDTKSEVKLLQCD